MASELFSARSIAISGATSGIGLALALDYAAPDVTLHLIGRNVERLAKVAEQARAKHAIVRTGAIDVRDREALRDFLLQGDALAPVDCIVASAGVTAGSAPEGGAEDFAQGYELIDINLVGALNFVTPLVPALRRRRRGRIGLVSSLAAFAPQADGVAYSATKAALLGYALAARDKWREDNVGVSAICPGFVDTPMAASYVGWKPLTMTPEKAARLIRRGLERDRGVIAFPLPLYLATRLQALLPEPLRRLGMSGFRFAIRPPAPASDETIA